MDVVKIFIPNPKITTRKAKWKNASETIRKEKNTQRNVHWQVCSLERLYGLAKATHRILTEKMEKRSSKGLFKGFVKKETKL